MSEKKADARQRRALEWTELSDARRDRVAAVILSGMSAAEAERAIARIRADGMAAQDEIVRRYHADTANRMERLLRRALAARLEVAERAVIEANAPNPLPPLATEEEVLAFAELVTASEDGRAIRLDLRRWSDVLQRHIDLPAYALWPMACLAYEVDVSVPQDVRTPELDAWVWRVQAAVVDVVGAADWDAAVSIMHIPDRRRSSLAAWLESGEGPRDLEERLRRSE